jgi:hypothetical protein
MQKLVWGLLLCLLLSTTAALAQVVCKDLDEEPNIEDSLDTAAKVEYGITPKTDECVSGKDGYHKDPSSWVREYYCAETTIGEGQKAVQRVYKDFDCTRFGYDKCEGGKCMGKPEAAAKPRAPEQPRCGDKILQSERGEQCEPPDDICYVNEQIGICTRPDKVTNLGGCQCKLYKPGAAPEAPPAEHPPAPAPVERPPAPPTEAPPAEAPPIEQPPAEEERAPLPTEEAEEPKGIGFTRSISNAVKRFFAWIGSWFD